MNLNLNSTKYLFLNIFVLIVYFFIFILLYTSIQETQQNQIQQSVKNELIDIKTSISEVLLQSVRELSATSAVLVFNPDATLSQFQNYAKEQIRHQYKDFILEWQPIVYHKDRESFEKKAREQGMKNFYLWEPDENGNPIPAKKKEEYVPVFYMLSQQVDINTLGIDLAWSKERMDSKYLARDLGIAQASEFFNMVTNKINEYTPIGFAITYPVYKKGLVPSSIEAKQENILGYLAGVYSISSLFQDIIKDIDKKKLIFSINSSGNKDLVFHQNNWGKPSYIHTTKIDVYGTKWDISLGASEVYIEENFSNNQRYFLIIQFILVMIIIAILNVIYRKNEELRNNRQRIQEQKEEFESIFNYAKDGIAIVTLDGDFIKTNQAFLDITGYDKEEILSKNCIDITTNEYKQTNKNMIQDTMEKGYTENIDKVCLRKDNISINVSISMSLLPNKQTILVIIHDTTSLKLLQEQLKNASLGEMIGNIAHQWRQPLSVISAGVTGMLMQKQYNSLSDEEFEEICNTINDNAQYLSKTIDDFKNFIKNDQKRLEFILKENIESFLHLVELSVKTENIQLILDLDESIKINGYPNELIQCYMNIFNNAKDALKDSSYEHKYFFIQTSQNNGYIVIKFKDNGGGIPSGILPQIFEPYFTTKHQSIGTGLGLSMTYNLITKGMNGTIEAQNINFNYEDSVYSGAEFIIKLPID